MYVYIHTYICNVDNVCWATSEANKGALTLSLHNMVDSHFNVDNIQRSRLRLMLSPEFQVGQHRNMYLACGTITRD